MRTLIALVALLVAMSHAQGVWQDQVSVDDVLKLFDNSVAIEVEVPEGATLFSLGYGTADSPHTFTTSLRQGPSAIPTRLRVVVFLPDESQVNPCPATWAEATIVATPIVPTGSLGHHRQRVCVPHPSKSEITGRPRIVLEGDGPQLGRWAPLLFHTWMVMTERDADGRFQSAIDLEKNFVVHVHFGTGETLTLPDDPKPTLRELTAMPAIAELLIERGVLGGP